MAGEYSARELANPLVASSSQPAGAFQQLLLLGLLNIEGGPSESKFPPCKARLLLSEQNHFEPEIATFPSSSLRVLQVLVVHFG